MTETSEKICGEHVAKLNKTFSSGKTLPYEFRVSQLLALKKLVDENDVAIVEAIGKDLGTNRYICDTELNPWTLYLT